MSDEPAAAATISFEYADLELLGVDAEAGTVGPAISECAGLLSACGVDVSAARLVITGDFVRSVRDRGEPGSTYHENYDTARNTGVVGGKTIKRPDSTIDILLHAAFFESDGKELGQDLEIGYRTLIHEAQHVVIYQNGEDASDFEGEPWARRNFLVCADQVMEEYRAEVVACRVVSRGGWNTSDLRETVRAWFEILQRVAVLEYQDHLDVGKLAYDVLQETHTLWKLLAYVAAELHVTGETLSRDITDDELWALTIAPHWADFIALLNTVPDGQQRTTRVELQSATENLADLMARWLPTLGFSCRDASEGSEFLITSWDLLLAELP